MIVVLSVDTHLLPVQEAIWKARSQWKRIGYELGLQQEDIEAIMEPLKEQCLHKMLLLWMQSGRATTNHLLDALNSSSVNRPDIAMEIDSLEGTARLEIGLSNLSYQLYKAVKDGNLEEVKQILHDDQRQTLGIF